MSAVSLNNESAVQSLLSLSIAAASANPIPTSTSAASDIGDNAVLDDDIAHENLDASHACVNGSQTDTGVSLGSSRSHLNTHKHRRLSSIGQSRRRTNEAREATGHPSPAALQTAASALTSLAALSLSSSAPQVNGMSMPDEEILDLISDKAEAKLDEMGISVSTTKTGKKRGTIFKCESCSKVYRHPSCLIKHRWEHSPHWREASKFLLSKHQQVQLLEAAAILSHLSPTTSGGTSLPEDRALWPSYLSGGTLPLPSTSSSNTAIPPNSANNTEYISHPTSSSVPTRASSSGPRMHDYAVLDPTSITQLRPGVVGVPTDHNQSPHHSVFIPGSSPVPVPGIGNMAGGRINLWGVSSTSALYSGGSNTRSEGTGGWSLPNSSIRSGSSSPPTDDEEDFADMDDAMATQQTYGFTSRGFNRANVKHDSDQVGVHAREAEWDGMEMEMEI